MEETGTIGTLLAVFILLSSYKGFQDRSFTEEYIFDVDRILINKEYRRLITSGFLHGGWFHLIFNMIALLSFSREIENLFGIPYYLLLYFLSLIGGNLLSLYIHRNHGDYRAVGASGAISGVVFASVVLMPESKISFILIPIEFSSWIFGLMFILVSIFGIKSQSDNIGHEAHLGGAIIGILLTVALYPVVLEHNLWVVAMLLIPAILFILLLIRNPNILIIDNYWGEGLAKFKENLANRQVEEELDPEEELNALLEKIRKGGMNSLSSKERSRLDQLSER